MGANGCGEDVRWVGVAAGFADGVAMVRERGENEAIKWVS